MGNYQIPVNGRKNRLFIGICGAGDFVESAGNTEANKIISVVIIGIPVLIILHQLVAAGGNVVEVVKKSLSCSKLQSKVPFGIKNILHPQAERDGNLDIAIFRCLILGT